MSLLRSILIVIGLNLIINSVAHAQFSIKFGGGEKKELPVTDIGERDAGQIYDLTLVGQNFDCKKPQDFRFDVSSINWLSIPGDNVVRDLAPGQQGSLPAEADFTGMQPGDYEGQLNITCETCQFLIFKNCSVDKQSVLLKVHLVEPGRVVLTESVQPGPEEHDEDGITDSDATDSDEIVGAAGTIQGWDPTGSDDEFDSDNTPEADEDSDDCQDCVFGDSDFEEQAGDQTQADNLRDEQSDQPANTAAADTVQPQPGPTPAEVKLLSDDQRRNLENTRAEAIRTAGVRETSNKNHNDCLEELARLRTNRDQAKAAADAAAAQAQPLAEAAATAQAHLDAYDADVESANAADDRALVRVNTQSRVLGLKTAGTPEYASAEAALAEAVESKNALAIALQRTRASLTARQAAARNAIAASETAAVAAANTASALASAQAALDAKALECGALATAKAQSEQAATVAAAAAAKAEADAPGQAATNAKIAAAAQKVALQTAIDTKQAALQRCLGELRHRAFILEQMAKALQDIGVIGGTPTTDRELDVEGAVTELIVTTAVDGVADLLNIATFQVFTILDSMKAAYGIVDILRLDLTPSRSGYDGDENLDNWLEKTKGYADNPRDAAEIRNAMTEFINHGGNPASLKEKWERQVARCSRLENELTALKAQQAAQSIGK